MPAVGIGGGGAVRWPPNKKGYEIQGNTLDMMWKGTAALAGTTTGQDAMQGIVNAVATVTGDLTKPEVAAPIAGTLLFTAVQGMINPNALAIGGGFGLLLAGVGVTAYVMETWGHDAAKLEEWDKITVEAWEEWEEYTGHTQAEVLEYFEIDAVLNNYLATGELSAISAPENPFVEPLEITPNVEQIVTEFIEKHSEIREVILENTPPDYVKPEIVEDLKSNLFNKGLLAPIGLFRLILFFKRRRRKKQ